MALIKCPECSKEISDKSKVCIHCGYPLEEELQATKNNIFKEGNPFVTDNQEQTEESTIEEDITKPSKDEEIPKKESFIEEKETNNSNDDDKTLKNIIIIFTIIIVLVFGIMMITRKTNKKEVQTNERNEYVDQIMITAEYINIRKGRSTSTEKLGKVYKGEIYTILSEGDAGYMHWYEIKTTNGIKGYIADREGYTKKLNTTSYEYNEQTTTTTTPTTILKPTTKPTTKKTNKPQNTTTKSQSTTTKASTTTTTTTKKVEKPYSVQINGVGEQYIGGYSQGAYLCTVESFNASAEKGYNNDNTRLNYSYKVRLDSCNSETCSCLLKFKVYDSSNSVIDTRSISGLYLSPGESSTASTYIYIDSPNKNYTIKIIGFQ